MTARMKFTRGRLMLGLLLLGMPLATASAQPPGPRSLQSPSEAPDKDGEILQQALGDLRLAGPGWKVVHDPNGRQLFLSGSGPGMVVLPHRWEDFRVGPRLMLPRGGIMICFRHAGPHSRYEFLLTPTGFRLGKSSGPGPRSILSTGPWNGKPDQWHEVEIFAQGGRLAANIDGNACMQYTDDNPWLSGVIFFALSPDTEVYVDEVAVRGVVASAPDQTPGDISSSPQTRLHLRFLPSRPEAGFAAQDDSANVPAPGVGNTPLFDGRSPDGASGFGADPTVQPGQTSPGQSLMPVPQGQTLTENFDRDPQGWYYSCQKQLIPEGSGYALRTSGGGHAVWASAGQLTDFLLSSRHRYEEGKGTGDVVFRASGAPPNNVMYGLLLGSQNISLSRRGVQNQELKSAPFQLTPGVWHDVAVRVVGARIEVTVDSQPVLSLDDPNPLPAGTCGLGVILDSGSVDYDDASLTPSRAAGYP